MRALLVLLAAVTLLAPSARAGTGFVTEDGERTRVERGAEPGLLTSDSTRIDGLVTRHDLDAGRFRVAEHDDPAEALRTLEERIERNDRWRLPLTILVAAGVLALAALRPSLALRGLLVALAANLWLSPVLAVAAGLAAVALPLGWACAVLLAAYLAALGLDAEAVALSPLGPSQVNRFYGVNNLLETMLLAPALVGTALLGRAGIGVAGLALVTVGGNRFGADGGGIVVLAASLLVLWARLRSERLGWRHAAVAAAAVVALVALDAATGGSSHVTDALGDGPAALAGDLGDRIERSVSRTADSPGAIAVVLGSLAVLAAVVLRAPKTPVLTAYLVGLGVSLVVNDTPSDVLGMGAAIAVALARDPLRNERIRLGTMRRAAVMLALVALLLGAAGCGGEEVVRPVPETVEGTLPEVETTEGPAITLEGDASNGEQIFSSAGCGGCHTLEAAGSSGTVGPNLDEAQPSLALAIQRVTNGAGAMPPYKDQLSEQEIVDVATFVVESTS